MKRLSAIIIVMMLIVAIPTETFAVSKPSQVKNLKASAKTTSSITLKWNKVKAAKGYEVQQYNSKTKKWKTLKKVKVLNYKHTKLKANTLYKYRVRAYKTYKQYYNSKTKKWQNKKPAKKNWKNKKTRTKYVYGKVSKTINVRTNKSKASNNTSNGSTSHTHSWSNWTKVDNTNHKRTCTDPSHVETKAHSWDNGVVTTQATTTSEGVKTYTCSVCNGTKEETIPKIDVPQIDPYSVPLNYWQGMSDDGFPVGSQLTMTNYENKTSIYEKKYANVWKNTTYSGTISLTNPNLPLYNRNLNGEFTTGGGAKMLNQSGATFDLTTFGEFDTIIGRYMFTAYNLDESKLQIVSHDAEIKTIDTYTLERNPQKTQKTYYVKTINNVDYRLAYARSDKKTYTTEKVGNTKTNVYVEFMCDATAIGNGMGLCATTVDFQVKYDDKIIGTIKTDSTRTTYHRNWSADQFQDIKMSPVREKCWQIAIKAVGQPVDYDTDMKKIEQYIKNKYYYGEKVYYEKDGSELFEMKCTGGALVLETYSILMYDEYGFTTPRGGINNDHRSFSPISSPDTVYQTEGHQ